MRFDGNGNNASYLNYIEHARHECMKSEEIDFSELAQIGSAINERGKPILPKEIDQIVPKRSGM